MAKARKNGYTKNFRKKVVLYFLHHGNKQQCALKFSISRPTLDKWIYRYEQEGLSGLNEKSSSPHNPRRINQKVIDIISKIKKEYPTISYIRISAIAKVDYDISVSDKTIKKYLDMD